MIGRKNNKSDIVKKVAIGSTIAAGIGYLAGILTAPKSGKETRKDIQKSASKTAKEAEKELKKVNAELSEALASAKKQGVKLTVAAKKELMQLQVAAADANEKLKEVISALREGEASDADLQKAIKQANNSIKNLKKYLKK